MYHRSAGKHKASRSKSQPAASGAGQVRIIAGRWRGTRLQVPDLAGLRPSGDRTRETLFNWLQAWLPGARCLDLFAGSGALGFEAASRGAATVLLVDSQAVAIRSINATRRRLEAVDTAAIQADALIWLRDCAERFDVIFVDPPFADALHQQAIDLLLAHGLLNPGGWLYVEVPVGTRLQTPAQLVISKEKRIGDVMLYLFRNSRPDLVYNPVPLTN